MNLLQATWILYRDAFRAAALSFSRAWWVVLAVVAFFAAMVFFTGFVGGLGVAGGLIMGAVNALLIGAILALFEAAILSARRVSFQDVVDCFGKYFWDVMGVGFVLWIPLMVLDQGMRTNPNGAFLSSAIFFLLFVLLNPAPEVIYQLQHNSPLDVFKSSYEFVIENWIEWFLPLLIAIGPLGLTFFLTLSTRLGRGAGLNFLQILVLPFTVLSGWLAALGLPEGLSNTLVLLLTPPVTVFIFLFRGHLFHTLHTSSRRGRLYQTRQQP